VAALDVEDPLAWEAKQRKSAAIAAGLAGVLTAVGMAWRAITLNGGPSPGLLEAVGRLQDPGPPIGSQRSLALPFFQHYQDNAVPIVAAVVLVAIGSVALGWALTYLAVATRARRPEFPKLLLYLPVVAGILNGVYVVASEISRLLDYDNVLSGPGTVDAVLDLGVNGFAIFAAIVGLPGTLGLALALVFVSLNAMRVGLLTRFLGILGMICGGLAVLSQFVFSFVVTFWLVALGLLFLDVTPGGAPPAWRTGQPEPWPSQREVAEARRAARDPAPEPQPQPQTQPEPAVASGPAERQHPSSRKRKRKRRG
jgi:hypothetical protein